MGKRKKRVTSFGQRLRALREAAGLSLSELGRRADMPYQTIAKYERSEIEPNWPSVLDLATALGVSAAAFQGEGEPAAGPAPGTTDQVSDDPSSSPVRRPMGKRK